MLTERAIARIGRGWLTRDNREAWEQLRADLIKELAQNDKFTAALDELWPILTPETLLAQLYMSPERLRAAGADQTLFRADGAAWTVSDVPLLDELVDLLGGDKSADEAAERERKAETEYAAGVLDNMISREDLMDDEDHLLAHGPALRRGPGGSLRRARHPGTRRTRCRGPGLDLPARRRRRGPGTVRNGLAGADAALPEPLLHGGRRSRPAPVGGRSDIVGHDAGAVRAGPLGLPVAVGELPHAGGDHDRRRGAARRVRARGRTAGVGPRVRHPAVVTAGHRGRTAGSHRGIRPGRGRHAMAPAS